MFQIKVKDAGRFEDLAAGGTVIKVDYDIVTPATGEGEEDIVHLSRSESFPLATPKEEIEAALQKQLHTFVGELEAKAAQEKVDAEYAAADKTIDALQGLTIGNHAHDSTEG